MATAEEVRAMFPNAVAFADEFRNVFGDGVKLVYAEENGKTIGKKNPEEGKWVTPYIPPPKRDDDGNK